MDTPPWRHELEHDGYALLPGVFGPQAVAAMSAALEGAFADRGGEDAAIRGEGVVYAARNVLSLWPGAADAWRVPPLPEALAAVLGPEFGLVRALFFDKPPGQGWALPWHKDLTVAVRDNRLGGCFGKPTRKAGVPHAEAPRAVLDAMLTARVHLDAVGVDNGPLKVVPGSHHAGKVLCLDHAPPRTLLAEAGDVLLIRPLVAHCSGRSHPDTARHRRILHLEFAASRLLPDGYEWHTFVAGLSGA